jgi:hypothetical protein
MYTRHLPAVVLVCLTSTLSVVAFERERYTVPRTEHGHPDFQGNWATSFLTTLERPAGVATLVVTQDEARKLAAAIRARMPAVIDPDVQLHDIQQLAMVKGEYRTSVIVDPEDGRLPFTPKGLDLAAHVEARNTTYDDPEQRPLAERCLENLGYAPMRALRVTLPRQIVQTRDAVVISSEDSSGARIIRLGGQAPPEAVRSIGGYSAGHWENETLVVVTTHLRADDPARNVAGRPLLLSRRSTVIERFTRVSPTELFYRFTVEDDELYTRPWSGEFSMMRFDQPIYEYACHEANYSLTNILLGGRAQSEQ